MSQRTILLGAVSLIILSGAMIWIAQYRGSAFDDAGKGTNEADEPVALAADGVASRFVASSANTQSNVTNADTSPEVPEKPEGSPVDSEPLQNRTVSEDLVTSRTPDNPPEAASATVADEPNGVTRLRESVLEGPYGKKPIVEVLPDLVDEDNPLQARQQILAIVLRKQEALPVLKEALLTGDDATKWTVLSLLQKNLQWQEMSGEVLALLNDPNLPDKVLARAIAASVALDMTAAGETIHTILAEQEKDDVREVAIRAIGELSHADARNDLRNALAEPSARIALAAAESLGKMGDPSGFSIVAKHMGHPDWFIRKLAAQAMGHIGTDAALSALERTRLVSEESPMAKAEIEISKNRILMRRKSRAERLSHLSQLLDSENRFVSRWAHDQIRKEFPDDCIQIFRERSRTAPEELRSAIETYLLLAEEHKKGGER